MGVHLHVCSVMHVLCIVLLNVYILPLIICLFYGVYVFCVGNLVGSWFLSFLLCESFLASML